MEPNVLTIRSKHSHRGYSTCLRCVEPWDEVASHPTKYGGGRRSLFPLCEGCWSALTPELRLPYYRILVFEVWGDPSDWADIEANVLAGL